MRSKVAHLADVVRLSARKPIETQGNEEFVEADLADADAVMRMVEGCDGILHLGGASSEMAFSRIMDGNILGLYNLYEAARAHGHPRILFASSNHVVGFHPQEAHLDADARPRPDGLYGVSKCFGEALAQMYHDKFGQETAIVRIGSCYEQPTDRRMLSTWLSFDDFASLTERVFAVQRLGCPIVWGVSDNDSLWWDNRQAAYIGWKPNDNAAQYRKEVEAQTPTPDPRDPVAVWQGGHRTQEPIYTDD